MGILPTGFIYPKQSRAVRDVLRRRLLLVKQKTAQLLSLQSTISRHTGIRLSSLKIKQLTPNQIAHYMSDPSARFSAQQSHQLLQYIEQQVRDIESFVLAQCDQNAYGIVTSTPGIGKILGMTILLETGPIERLKWSNKFVPIDRC